MNVWKMVSTFCDEQRKVAVFLVNGVKLSGIITHVDEDGLNLARDGVTQGVFRQAIATVMPVESL